MYIYGFSIFVNIYYRSFFPNSFEIMMSISGRVEVDFDTWTSVGHCKLSFGHSSRILSHCCCYENTVRHHRYKIVSQQTVTKCCYTKRSFWMRNFLRRLLGVSVIISHLEMNTREDTVTSAMTNNIFPLPIRNCCEHLCFFFLFHRHYGSLVGNLQAR